VSPADAGAGGRLSDLQRSIPDPAQAEDSDSSCRSELGFWPSGSPVQIRSPNSRKPASEAGWPLMSKRRLGPFLDASYQLGHRDAAPNRATPRSLRLSSRAPPRRSIRSARLAPDSLVAGLDASYSAWNAVIAERFFRPDLAGRPAYLSVD